MPIFIATGLIVIGSVVFQEFDYKQAWSEGYKDGYCYDVEGTCISPIVPIPPIARIQDTTYSNAYNRGFLTGLKAQK